MRKFAKESVIYTAVFCLGYLVACQSGSKSVVDTPTAAVPRMLNSNSRQAAIVQSGTNALPAMASLFGSGGSAPLAVTIANPSAVSQSYESTCYDFGNGSSGGGNVNSIHAFWGNSGLVSMNYAFGTFGACYQPQLFNTVGGDENGVPQGYPVIIDGTINTLVTYGGFVSGKKFRCVDTTNSSSISDGAFVRAYYDLAHDAIILGSGTTQLSPTCSISIPAGDDVLYIAVQWLKS
jgi:hypothetical protein